MSTYTMAAVEARTLAGEMVPMDATPGGRGEARVHACASRSASSARSARSTSRSTSSRTRSRRPSPPAAPSSSSRRRRRRSPRSCSPSSSTTPGCPPGWLNVLVGPASEIGDVLVDDERVKLITFTGSAGVGWKLRERAPRKRVNLELGNATPVIVEADADVDDAATRCAANAFSFAGQSCISVQRIYVQRSVYDEFRAAFVPRVEALVVGDPADEATDVGPLISESERDRVLDWIERGARRRRARSSPAAASTATCCSRPSSSSRRRTRSSRATRRSGPSARCSRTTTLDEAIDARQRDAVRPPGRDLHDEHPHRAHGGRAGSSSAA